MVYSASVCVGGDYNGFCNSPFHECSSANVGFNHERRGSDRHLLGNRIRHDCTYRHRIFPGFHDEPIQCVRVLAAIGFVDRS